MRRSALFFAFLLGLCPLGIAQDVVSASSGVLQYFEGAVALDDHVIEHKAAVFPSLKDGSTLKTGKGRAESLLTPAVYLRLDEDTSVRMLSNSLADTRIEVVRGAVLLDNLNAPPADVVTLLYQGSPVHFPRPGIYRIDCNLGELQIYSGQAEVRRASAPSVPVDAQHLYYFDLQLTTSKFGEGADDEFYDWAHNRSDTIVERNEQASAEQAESQDPDPGASGGLLGAMPSFAPPSLVTPNSGYGSIWNSYGYGSMTSPLLSASPPFTPFLFSTAAVVILSHPVGVKWPPVTGPGSHPRPILNRWPTLTSAGSLLGSGAGGRFPVGSSAYRPSGLSVPAYQIPAVHVSAGVPRVSSPPVASHAATPQVVPHVLGHR